MAAVVRVEDQEVTRDLRAVTTIDREGPHGDEATRVLPEPVVGARVGRYEITGRLGAGGMGVVLAAHDARLDRGVALKLLRRDRAPLGAAWSEGRARLLREAQAMAQLSHPNVVEVYDVGVAQDGLYIAMERIDGGTLRAWLAEHRPGWAAVTRIFVQAGRGLAAAHAADLIHRDFKPSNVLIDRHQRARVVDFGLALPTVGRVRPESGPLPAANWVDGRLMVSASGATDRLSAPVTEAGMVMGTPAYMAPEQHLGGEVGPVADQFAFCASLFEGLYGQRPFMGGTARELLRVKKSGPPPPPTSTRVPRAVHQIVARGLRPHAEHRWPSMTALLDALEAAVSPRGKHGARLAVGAVVMVSAAAVVVANGATGGADTETVACASQADRMDVAWDDGRRRTLRHTLSEVGAGYAVDTAERVDRHLDDYRARWEQQLANVCGSTPRDKHEWTRREEQLACLERRRRRMATTVEVLMGTDAKLLPQAIALVKGLPSVEQCAVSTAPADMTLPDDPVVAARAREVLAQLEEVKVWLDAGHYEQARERAAQLHAEAETLGVAWLIDRTEVWLADSLLLLGQIEQAEARLVDIVHRAEAAGHDDLVAYAIGRLLFLVGHRAVRPDDALQWVPHGEAVLARLVDDPEAEADLRTSIGSAFSDAGRAREAAEELSAAVASWTACRGADDLQTAVARNNLGIAYMGLGRFDDAIEEYEHVRRIRQLHLGPDHPDMGVVLNNLANARFEVGQPQRAMALQRRVYEIWRAGLGEEHAYVATALNNLGNSAASLRRHEEAISYYRRAIALRERTLGPDHPELATSRLNLGAVLGEVERHEEALVELSAAHAVLERAMGEHPWTATGLAARGVVEHAAGDPVAALASLEAALAMRLRIHETGHPSIASSRYTLAKVLADPKIDRLEPALELLEGALAVQQEAAVSPEALADTRWWLAQVLVQLQRDLDRARTLAKEAHTYWVTGPAHMRHRAVEAEAWLARLDASLGPAVEAADGEP